MDAAMIDGIEAKLTAESGAMTYDFPSDGKNYMLAPATVTATYFSVVDTTADAGSFAKTYGGSAAAATKQADDLKAVTDWNKKKTDYLTAVGAYNDKVKKYIDTYTDVLAEIWDDFIGKARTEEEALEGLLNVGSKPSAPTKPTTTLTNPLVTDFDCAGQPCKFSSTTETSGTRNFGVAGPLDSATFPLDYPKDEVDFYTAKASSNTKAWENIKEACRPKVMHVNVNLKADTAPTITTTNTHKAVLTFASKVQQDLSGYLVVDNVNDISLSVSGATGIADLDKYYEANGSSSLMASGIVAAALATMTLY